MVEVWCSLRVSGLWNCILGLGWFERVGLSRMAGCDAAARAWSVWKCLESLFLVLGVRKLISCVPEKPLRSEASLQMSSGSGPGAISMLNMCVRFSKLG